MNESTLFEVYVHCRRLFPYWSNFVRRMTVENVDLSRAQYITVHHYRAWGSMGRKSTNLSEMQCQEKNIKRLSYDQPSEAASIASEERCSLRIQGY